MNASSVDLQCFNSTHLRTSLLQNVIVVIFLLCYVHIISFSMERWSCVWSSSLECLSEVSFRGSVLQSRIRLFSFTLLRFVQCGSQMEAKKEQRRSFLSKEGRNLSFTWKLIKVFFPYIIALCVHPNGKRRFQELSNWRVKSSNCCGDLLRIGFASSVADCLQWGVMAPLEGGVMGVS